MSLEFRGDPCSKKGDRYLAFLNKTISAKQELVDNPQLMQQRLGQGHGVSLLNSVERKEQLEEFIETRDELLKLRQSAGC